MRTLRNISPAEESDASIWMDHQVLPDKAAFCWMCSLSRGDDPGGDYHARNQWINKPGSVREDQPYEFAWNVTLLSDIKDGPDRLINIAQIKADRSNVVLYLRLYFGNYELIVRNRSTNERASVVYSIPAIRYSNEDFLINANFSVNGFISVKHNGTEVYNLNGDTLMIDGDTMHMDVGPYWGRLDIESVLNEIELIYRDIYIKES